MTQCLCKVLSTLTVEGQVDIYCYDVSLVVGRWALLFLLENRECPTPKLINMSSSSHCSVLLLCYQYTEKHFSIHSYSAPHTQLKCFFHDFSLQFSDFMHQFDWPSCVYCTTGNGEKSTFVRISFPLTDFIRDILSTTTSKCLLRLLTPLSWIKAAFSFHSDTLLHLPPIWDPFRHLF